MRRIWNWLTTLLSRTEPGTNIPTKVRVSVTARKVHVDGSLGEEIEVKNIRVEEVPSWPQS